MNAVMKMLWLWQARRKLEHDDLIMRYPAIHLIGDWGNSGDFELLLNYLNDPSQIIRNSIMSSLKKLLVKYEEDEETHREMRSLITDQFNAANTLIEKISAIEVLRVLPIRLREMLLGNMVEETESDLQYQVINSLGDTQNIEILDAVLRSSESKDLILKRKALETWYTGLENKEFDDVLTYCTNNLHALIRANYELQLSGTFMKKILSYANQNELPEPKAYPDFIIRYLNELLTKWEYDPDANRSMHAIVVPSYFTFNQDTDKETTYVVL